MYVVKLPDSFYHRCIVWYCVVRCGTVWYCVVRCGIVHYNCLVSAGLGNSSKLQIQLYEGRRLLGTILINKFIEFSGEWIYEVDVVKLLNLGGMIGGDANLKRKNMDF